MINIDVRLILELQEENSKIRSNKEYEILNSINGEQCVNNEIVASSINKATIFFNI
jgi:hypothetical protein